jgi:alginate O-acetyltransferase complex protein AlgI
MAGLGAARPAEALLGAVVYGPYYAGTFLVAAVVTWMCPQTWDWTRTITPLRAVAIAGAFVLAAVVLTTQAFNPFIYFIF